VVVGKHASLLRFTCSDQSNLSRLEQWRFYITSRAHQCGATSRAATGTPDDGCSTTPMTSPLVADAIEGHVTRCASFWFFGAILSARCCFVRCWRSSRRCSWASRRTWKKMASVS